MPDFSLTPISDDPVNEAKLFGFDELSDKLTEFTTSDRTITPFVIAINGEWGSGKSSLLLTTKKKLENKIPLLTKKMKVVYFDAWEYENSNPAAALVYRMMKPIESQNAANAMNIGKLVVDLAARNILNMSLSDMKSHFEESVHAVDSLGTHIQKTLNDSLPDGRLIVLIDDLDRCKIENTLSILNSLKLFLSLKQCLFVVAVDMKKLELAWKTQYGIDAEIRTEGTSYLDKIFQMKIGLPPKPKDELKKYIKSLIPTMPDNLTELMAVTGPKNLRRIKRLINIASFHAFGGTHKAKKFELSLIWMLFEFQLNTKSMAIDIHNNIEGETGFDLLTLLKEKIPLDADGFNEYLRTGPPFARYGGGGSIPGKFKIFCTMIRPILESFPESHSELKKSLNEIVISAEESQEENDRFDSL
jgi:hypothetical protein